MEDHTDFVIVNILLVVLVLFIIGLNIYKFADFFSYYFFKRPVFIHFPFFLKKLPFHQQKIIQTYFPIYNRLSPYHKALYNHRVVKFIEYHDFVGREGVVVDESMKVLIASCGVLLTFGMRYFDIPGVERIIIFPDVYYSEMNENYHKGEYNPAYKTVVFSWKHFMMGLKDEHDGINLGFHEFAHALFFSSLQANDTGAQVFKDGLDYLNEILLNDQKLTHIKETGFLRSYAFTNNIEFFSVCIETFVENPIMFKKELPELYSLLIVMLNFKFIEKNSIN